MNDNQRLTSRTSPERDPVLLAIKAACAVLALAALLIFIPVLHRHMALASLHCPAPDHAVWADSLGPWYWRGEALCGASLTVGVTSR